MSKSASELLRELEKPMKSDITLMAYPRQLIALGRALPELRAVVEAAEWIYAKAKDRHERPVGTREGVIGAGAVAAALDEPLAALREKLGQA